MKIIKNTFLITISKILNLTTNFVLGLIILKKYTLDFFGIIAFTISLVNFFISLASWGFNQYTIREISATGRKNFQKNQLLQVIQIKVFFCIIFSFLYIILYGLILKNITFLDFSVHIKLVILSSLIIYFDSFKHFFNNSLYSVGIMQIETISIIIEKIILFISIIFCVNQKYTILYFIICLVFSKFISFVFSFYFFKKIIGFIFSIKYEIKNIIEIIKKSAPFFFQILMAYLFFQTDIILLGLFSTNEDVGSYQIVMSIVSALIVIPWAYMNTLYPKLVRKYKAKQIRGLKANVKQISIYSFLVTIPLAFLLFKFSENIMFYLYFENAEKLMYIFSVIIWLIIFRFQTYLFGYFLDAVGMEKDRALIVTYAALINLILNLFLIPNYYSFGAAISVFISDFILVIMSFYKTKKFFKKIAI
ncbi:MAG TPA: oligosaccharide flippase family protein [bacterium]|nr:oligosaccharide flippase family protein [bacterium]HPQ18164.1 oligosaccharide flippase family protein [bacterium]